MNNLGTRLHWGERTFGWRVLTVVFAWLLAMLAASPGGTPVRVSVAVGAESAPAFVGQKGLGGIRPFFFPRQSPTDPAKYELDPYDRWDATMPRSRLDEIAAAGFDFLRLVIDPGPLLEADGDLFERRLSPLKGAIDSTLAAGLNVLVDMHVSNTHPVWGSKQITQGFEHPAFRRYLEVIGKLAGFLSSYPAQRVAFEVFNEPPSPCIWRDRPDWPEQLSQIHLAARKAAPQHTLYIAGSCWARIEGLATLDASKFDPNTVFVFHYYEPFVFTHQSFWTGMKFQEFVSRLPFPPVPEEAEPALEEVTRRISAADKLSLVERLAATRQAGQHIRKYYATWKGVENVERDFGELREWANRHGVPPRRILLGEFGVMRDIYGRKAAAPEDRLRWIAAVRVTAEKFGYPWSVWEITGPMGISLGERSGPLDPAVLSALGLKP